jgi:hypothetical protein
MANPTKGKGKPADILANKREIPDPVAWMQAHMGPNEGAPGGQQTGQPVSQFGGDKPTQGDPAKNGFQSVNSHGKAQNGRKEPSSNFRGNGKQKKELSPNNTKKAGSQAKGNPAFGMPSRNAIARRIHRPVGQSTAQSAKEGRGRTGNLKNFEGTGKK